MVDEKLYIEKSSDDVDMKCILTQLAAARIVLEKLPVVPAVKIEENRIVSKLSDCVPVKEEEPGPEPELEPCPDPVPPTLVEEPPVPVKDTKRHHYFGANNNYYASCNNFN